MDDTGRDLLGHAAGLSPDLLRAYRALVATSSADGAELAATLDVPVGTARAWLDALASRGFATRLAGGAGGLGARRFVAAPPSVTLGAAVAAHEDAVRRAQAELDTLEEMYRLAGVEGAADEVVQMVRGADAVARWFTRVQAGARSEVLAFVQHPVAVTSADENAVEEELVERGVQYRVVLERTMLDEFPGGLDAFAESLAAGEEARIAESLPLRMVVVDRELAFLPVLADPLRASAAAMLVRPGALLSGLIALFDVVWATAAPVVLDAATAATAVGAADDVDARLLSLLLAGHTDEAAAHHLGVSQRTVQRRVRDLMDRAGVRTRVQLGWHAARAGWGERG
ncbi:LuxR family transcriptional regulator [Isoptericola hypogeus]|uniref:LuxR family transcriptional regulator n=1 Tax=Isoptericola hypogeus TaxID=300179 RepID=A0ABN2JCC8_9MICO